MRASLRIVILVVALVAVFALALRVRMGGGSVEELRVPVDTDAADMLVRLHEENQRLVGIVSNLQAEITELELKMAENALVGAVDAIAGQSVRSSRTQPLDAAVDPSRLQVVDVNREMMVAVVNGGLAAGIKPGMVFSVIRAEEVIAVFRVTEVREKVAGGLIEWGGKSAFPEPGDRLVLRTTQDG